MEFACPHCEDVSFNQQFALNRHIRQIHSGHKRFSCDRCGYMTDRNYQMFEHQKRGCGKRKAHPLPSPPSKKARQDEPPTFNRPRELEPEPSKLRPSRPSVIQPSNPVAAPSRPSVIQPSNPVAGPSRPSVIQTTPSPVAAPSNPSPVAGPSYHDPSQLDEGVAGPSKVPPSQQAPSVSDPWSCSKCSRIFKEKCTLTRHMKEVHGGAKQLNCPHCSYSTMRQHYLNWHLTFGKCQQKNVSKPLPKKTKIVHDDGSEHTHAFNKLVQLRDFKIRGKTEPIPLLDEYRSKVKKHIENELEKGPIKAQIVLRCVFEKKEDDSQEMKPSFNSQLRNILHIEEYDDFYKNAGDKIMESMGNFVKEGSGWTLQRISNINLFVSQYRPIKAGKYIPTPKSIAAKQAIINVQNTDDRCFEYAILSALHHDDLTPLQKVNANYVSNYKQWENTLNFDGITFPMSMKNIKKFEKQNNICVNIYIVKAEGKQIHPMFVTKTKDQEPINLLIIEGEKNNHYTWIKDFNSLLCFNYKNPKWFCPTCMWGFDKRCMNETKFQEHKQGCMEYGPQKIQFPSEGENKISYKDVSKEKRVAQVIYADFETILVPIEGCDQDPTVSSTTGKTRHEVCGYSYAVISPFFPQKYVTYRGQDAGEHFLRNMLKEEKQITEFEPKPLNLTDEEEKIFEKSETCHICKGPFEPDTVEDLGKGDKVRDHCHFTGVFHGAAHNSCNLLYRDTKQIPVFFHNLSGYDGHIIFDSLSKVEGIKTPKVVAKNMEKYITFSIGALRFKDSLQFLNSSLDKLVKNALGKDEDFTILKNLRQYFDKTWSHLGEDAFKMLTRKGVYPYSYMDSFKRFDETKLPPRKEYFNDLTNMDISEKDYNFAEELWDTFKLKNLGELHDLYVETDVLLLADVFEGYRDASLENYGLDPAHFCTAPSLSWTAALKFTKQELEIPLDPDMHMMFDKGLRGGISMVANQYARANNENLSDYNPKLPTSHIQYVDCNNLYGKAMSEYLPTGGFEWVETLGNSNEKSSWNDQILALGDQDKHGYILEVDLEYPEHLHELHDIYPLAPEHVIITEDMLSPHQKKIAEELKVKVGGKKLCTTLHNKSNYICHYRSLKKYVELGLNITNIHKIIKFKQSDWLKPYIQLNTDLRVKATTKFGVALAKLMNNAFFGKTCEDVRKYKNVSICTNAKDAKKRLGKNNVRGIKIFGENLIAVEATRNVVTLNKPRYIG